MGVGVSVGPLAQRGLNEALGLAIGLWSVGLGEAMFEAEGGDGVTHGVSAVAGAVVGVNALGFDAVLLEESQGGVEEGDGALCGFIREELGEGQAGVVIDGDVEELPAGAADVIALPVAGDAMAGACDARELLDVEVEKFARVRAFVAHDRRRRGELREAEAMAAQEAGDAGLGKLGRTGDLEARQPPAPQGEHTRDPERVGGSGGTCGARGAILKSREPLGAEAGEPFVGAAFRNGEPRRHLRHGLVEIDDAVDHLGSTHRGEFGLTVDVHAALVLGLVLLSQPHLSKSSPHEQPIGTSHLEHEPEQEQAAMQILGDGRCEAVVVSLGAAGVLFASRAGCERMRSPTVTVRSKVGAGDSAVAGMALSLARGHSLREAVRFGVASGAAAVMNAGTELCHRADAERLFAQAGW